VLASVLSGCEVKKQYAAECTTSPPVPHQPGEEIIIGADSGSSFIGTIPDGFSATCWAGGAEIVTLPIVEADEPS
jgi:hypothetical protein